MNTCHDIPVTASADNRDRLCFRILSLVDLVRTASAATAECDGWVSSMKLLRSGYQFHSKLSDRLVDVVRTRFDSPAIKILNCDGKK